MASYST